MSSRERSSRSLTRDLRSAASLCVLLSIWVCARAARGADVDGGAAGGDAGAATDGGVGTGESTTTGAADTGGGGLFEQSMAASGAGAGEGTAAVAPIFTLNGYVRGDAFVGKVPDERAAAMKANYGELALQLRTLKTSHGDGFAEARIRYGLQGDETRTSVDVREAYVNAHFGRLDLRLGQQIIVWGRADALNPTNNLTPVDFRIRSPLEDDIRLGNVGARGFLRLAPLRIEGVWMPVYLASELPPVGLPELVSFGRPTYPSSRIENGLVAGRVHLELPAFEMSVSYLRGYAPLPGLTLAGLTFDATNPGVTVSRTAYEHQVVGFDFSTALGDVMTLRAEAAYRRPFDYQNRSYAARPDVQYVLGADHNFGSLSVIVQYMGRYVLDWQKQSGTMRDSSELRGILMNPDPTNVANWTEIVTAEINSELAQINQILFSQTARVQHVATLRFEWLLAHETLTLSALGLYNVTTREWLAMPRIGYRASDALTLYVGGQIFAGPDDTLFGFIDQHLSAGYVELRYAF